MLQNRRPNEQKLLAFGFTKQEEQYICRRGIVDGQMTVTITVSAEGELSAGVTDNGSGEEYVLHRVPGAVGAFVGRVKAEYEALLEEIIAQCFDTEVFRYAQAKDVIAYVRDKYGDELEFLWTKFPDNAIVRRKDNQKWYAALLTVSRRKLGMASDARVEILDLRMKPEEIGVTVDGKLYFPGYHMNKAHWITLCLDGSLPLEEILRRLDDSYRLAGK